MMEKEHKEKEIMELKHEPEPGYRTGFYVALIIAALYLGMIFLKTM